MLFKILVKRKDLIPSFVSTLLRTSDDDLIRSLLSTRFGTLFGIDIRLLWNQLDGRIILAVSDSKTGDAFSIEIEPSDALEAFQHPYSYAAFTRERTLAV